MDKLLSTRRFDALAAAVLVVSVLLVYSNTFGSAFQFDDIHWITENPSIHDPGRLWKVFWQKRGLTMATFLLNYAAGGTDTTGYHVVNTAVHAVNSVLAYLFVLLTLGLSGFERGRSRVVALFASLLFAVHPVQTQSVTYIVQRMESLSALFSLLAMIAFIFSVRSEGFGRYALYALVGALFALAFHSKEIAFTLPALILLFDFCLVARGKVFGRKGGDGRGYGPVIRRWPVHALLGVLFIYFTFSTVIPVGGFSDLSGESTVAASAPAAPAPAAVEQARPKIKKTFDVTAGFGYEGMSPGEYLMTEFNVLVYYMTLLVYPANQNLDYDFPITVGLFKTPLKREGTVLNVPIPPPAVSLVILIAIIAASIYLLKRSLGGGSPEGLVIPFFVFWFFIILSPTSSFIPIADVIFEHRLYLPSLGFFTAGAVLLERLFTRILCPGTVLSGKRT